MCFNQRRQQAARRAFRDSRRDAKRGFVGQTLKKQQVLMIMRPTKQLLPQVLVIVRPTKQLPTMVHVMIRLSNQLQAMPHKHVQHLVRSLQQIVVNMVRPAHLVQPALMTCSASGWRQRCSAETSRGDFQIPYLPLCVFRTLFWWRDGAMWGVSSCHTSN